MSLSTVHDTFLFVATFPGGRQVFQNEKDLSAKDPTKNCYYDVLSDAEKPVSFVITDNDEFVFGVDLTDGHFEWNGKPFWLHRPELLKVTDFQVFWCRTVDHFALATPGKPLKSAGSKIAGYTIGWVGKDAKTGEHVERMFSIFV